MNALDLQQQLSVEMKVKRKLQRSPRRGQAGANNEHKLKAINSLYGSEATMENIKAGLGLNTSRRNKGPRRGLDGSFESNDISLPNSVEGSKEQNETKLPELPRHLVSQEGRKEKDPNDSS